MPRIKPIALDRAGNEVKCYTVREAAKELGMTLGEIKLLMFHQNKKIMPYYRLMGKAKKRKVIRITQEQLDSFKEARGFYDTIAENIVIARKEIPVVHFGMTQIELGKEIKVSSINLCKIERKKLRVTMNTLDKIAKYTGKPLLWFFENKANENK